MVRIGRKSGWVGVWMCMLCCDDRTSERRGWTRRWEMIRCEVRRLLRRGCRKDMLVVVNVFFYLSVKMFWNVSSRWFSLEVRICCIDDIKKMLGARWIV